MTNDKIQKLNPRYNAIVAYDLEKAKADLALTSQGFFAGLPFALKMLGQTHKGLPDTASSHLFSENVASEDDNYVKGLLEAGFTPFGQTNSPEFGFKNISDSKLYEMSGMKLIIREGLLAERRLPWLLGCLQLLELQMAVGRFGFQPHFRA